MDMLIRLTQEHTRTFRRIPGGGSVTRLASPPVPAVPKGCRLEGLRTRFLGAYGLAERRLYTANAHEMKSSPIHPGFQERLGTRGRFLSQPDKHVTLFEDRVA